MHFRAYLHDISRYSHFRAQKQETIRQNIGGGDIRYVVSNRASYWRTCPPPSVSAPMQRR